MCDITRTVCAAVLMAGLSGCGGSDQPSDALGRTGAPSDASSASLGTVFTKHNLPSATVSGEQGRRADDGAAASDVQITANVRSRLTSDDHMRHTRLEVTTYKGIVTLAGIVGSQEYADMARNLASQVPGVVSVNNQILVAIHVPTRVR